MAENPKFSIIVPVYNVEKYLKNCVDSITTQSFENFEAIIIDDGSTDGSGELLDKIEDSRFIIIHKKNGGVSSARNAGLDIAKGAYIIFLDPDDKLLPKSLETLFEALIQYPEASWIRGNNIVSSPDGSTRKENLHEDKRAPYCNRYLTQGEWFEHIVNAGELWATAFKKSILDEINLRFNPKLRNGEDGIFLVEYTYKGKGVYIANEVYDYLFQRPDGLSFTRAKTEADCISIVELAREWKNYVEKYSRDPLMGEICRNWFNKKVGNGIGSLSFVERRLRLKYLKEMKRLSPKLESRGNASIREKVKNMMYNHFLWTMLLPGTK